MKKKHGIVILSIALLVCFILCLLLVINKNYGKKTFKDKVKAGEEVSLLIIGDSIGGSTEENDWCMLLANQLINEGIKIKVDNISLGGNTVFAGYSQLAQYEQNADVIIFCFGQNDADNEDFPIIYENMIRLAKEKYPYAEEIAILESSQREYTNKINTIIRLCSYYDITYADMIYAFNNSGVSYDDLTSDGIHPNDTGKQLYANTILDIINKKFLSELDTIPMPLNEITTTATHYKYIAKNDMQVNNLVLTVNIDDEYSFVGADALFINGEHTIVGQLSNGEKFYVSYTWDYEPQRHIYKGSNSETIQGEITLTFDSQETLDNFYGLILCN